MSKNKNGAEEKKTPNKQGVSSSSLLCANDKIKMIANNALYFDDNSDYDTALWQILAIVSPELFKDDDPTPELSYIEST